EPLTRERPDEQGGMTGPAGDVLGLVEEAGPLLPVIGESGVDQVRGRQFSRFDALARLVVQPPVQPVQQVPAVPGPAVLAPPGLERTGQPQSGADTAATCPPAQRRAACHSCTYGASSVSDTVRGCPSASATTRSSVCNDQATCRSRAAGSSPAATSRRVAYARTCSDIRYRGPATTSTRDRSASSDRAPKA